MAYVSDETIDDVRRELDRFKREQHRDSGYAAAHLAGAIEILLEEAEDDTRMSVTRPESERPGGW